MSILLNQEQEGVGGVGGMLTVRVEDPENGYATILPAQVLAPGTPIRISVSGASIVPIISDRVTIYVTSPDGAVESRQVGVYLSSGNAWWDLKAPSKGGTYVVYATQPGSTAALPTQFTVAEMGYTPPPPPPPPPNGDDNLTTILAIGLGLVGVVLVARNMKKGR